MQFEDLFKYNNERYFKDYDLERERGILINADCLNVMKTLDDNSVDCVICDLPYGTTASSWDKIIDFNLLWNEYERIIKPSGAIALFSSGQFTYKLISSNEKLYKYKWVWVKTKKGNFVNAKNRPMTNYEEICMFSKGNTANGSKVKMNYYPQGLIRCDKMVKHGDNQFGTMAGKRPSHKKETFKEFTNYPSDVLYFNSVSKPKHPTEKPLDLLEYLVKTYSKENDIVLDNTCGSATTLVACKHTNRRYIGVELNRDYYEISVKRLKGEL